MRKRTVNKIVSPVTEIVFDKFYWFKNRGLHTSDKFPYFIHNFEVMPDGSLLGRRKLKKVADLPNAHSPFKIDNNRYLVFSNQDGFDKLFIFKHSTNTLKFITNTPSLYSRFWFVKVGDKIYISNRFWNGIYNIDDETVSDWKLSRTFTFDTSSEASEYVLAEAIGMPKVENLAYYAGRIFGSEGNRLWYSEAVFNDYTLPYYFVDFPDEINIVLSNGTFLLVGCSRKSYICAVSSENDFTLAIKEYNIGAIKGSGLVLNNMQIVWACDKGLCTATADGISIFTDDYVDVNIQDMIASGISNDIGYMLSKLRSISFTDTEINQLLEV